LDGPARLFEAGPLDDPLTRIALAVLQGEQIDPSQWKSVALGYETIELLTGLNSETREQRVVRVEKILDQMLTQLSVRADVRSFVSGFAVSRIAPGTLDHVGLLNETRRVLTGAVLWYGFAAGAVVKNSTTPFSHPLSWRIVRELERRTRVLDRPTADLGLGEFEMLMQRDSLPNDMVFGSMQQLEVELLPAVSTVLTLPDRFRAGEERGGEAEPTKLSKRAVDDVKRLIEIAYRTISGDVLGETGRDKGAQDKRETKGVARKKPRR
jgi:hypothetical protein